MPETITRSKYPPKEELRRFLRARNCVYTYNASEGFQNRSGSLFASTFARASTKTDIPRSGSSIINLATGVWPSSGRIDPAYTNQLIQSDDPSTSWTLTNVTDADGSATVPAFRSGGVSRLISTTSAGGYMESANFATKFSTASGTIYAFVAQGTGAVTNLELWNSTGAASVAIVSVTWTTGAVAVVSGTATVRVIERGANFIRLELNATAITTTNDHTMRIYPAAAGEGTVYYGGGQAEFLGIGHPYAPTTTLKVATVADALTANVGLTTGLGRTYIVMYERNYPAASYPTSNQLFSHILKTAGGNDELRVVTNGTLQIFNVLDNGSVIANPSVTDVGAGRHVSIASTVSGASFLYVNGVCSADDTDTYTHDTASSPTLRVGHNVGAASFANHIIRFLAVLDRALPRSECYLAERLVRSANP